MDTRSLQHVNVKVLAHEPRGVDLAGALTVFHRWIQEDACEELLIDVADYRHVPAGPGVILIGHEANYSLDQGGGRLGLLYNRKAPLPGGAREKIVLAIRAALAACRRLEGEPEFAGALQFDAGAIDVLINDRLLAPNTAESFAALEPELRRALEEVYGSRTLRIERAGGAGERLRIAVRAGARVNTGELLYARKAVR